MAEQPGLELYNRPTEQQAGGLQVVPGQDHRYRHPAYGAKVYNPHQPNDAIAAEDKHGQTQAGLEVVNPDVDTGGKGPKKKKRAGM